jgi:LytS/YehU family sensor histidine kinase
MIAAHSYALSQEWTRRRLQSHDHVLRATRLEIELLKKNIQPHFLLNTLRSISGWLDRTPATASKLVSALAQEMRMMLKVGGEKLIELDEEIRMCRSHLEVLALRGEKSHGLEVRGNTAGERVPPMILHTLMDQGLAGAVDSGSGIRFRLEVVRNGRLALILSHNGELKPFLPEELEATGFEYVKARLEESFPGEWKLEIRAEPGGRGWSATVETP